MAFRIPDFSFAPLKSASLCGLVRNENGAAKSSCLEAVLDSGSGVWIRSIVNAQEDRRGIHLHIEMARESQFGRPPQANAGLEEVLSSIDRFSGRIVEVYPEAQFEVARSELPADGVVALLSSVVIDDKIRLSAGTLTVGEPAGCTIDWRLEGEGDALGLVCTLRTAEEIPLDDSYLAGPIDRLKGVFQEIVLEQRKE